MTAHNPRGAARGGARALLALQLLASAGAGAAAAADTTGWIAHRPQAGGYRLLAPPGWVRALLPRSGIHAVVLHAPGDAAAGPATCTAIRRGDTALAGLSPEAAAAYRLDEASLRSAVGELGQDGEMRVLAPVLAEGRTAQHVAFASVVRTAAASLAFRGEALLFPTPDWVFAVTCRVSAPDAARAEAGFAAWRPELEAMLRSFTFE
jgi:hypothetical protein